MTTLPIINKFGAVEILRHDRKTVAVTAGVNFLDVDLRVNGLGSEYYDTKVFFACHSATAGVINYTINNIND